MAKPEMMYDQLQRPLLTFATRPRDLLLLRETCAVPRATHFANRPRALSSEGGQGPKLWDPAWTGLVRH